MSGHQVTAEGLAILRHATADGAGWRRYYCTEDGHADCEAMVASGLMSRGRECVPGYRDYMATDEGVAAALRACRKEQAAKGLRRWRWTYREVVGVPLASGVKLATSRSKARWQVAQSLADVDDRPMRVLFGLIDVRRAP